MIPTSTTVHTIFIKKLSYPFTSRPDELWIVERTADGRETWEASGNLFGKHAPHARPGYLTYYSQTIGANTTTYPSPHPLPLRQHLLQFFHTLNIPTLVSHNHFDAIPDQLHILQSCWGRSALHHSQGTTISLSWPPWRSTPPSSPSTTLHRTLQSNHPTTTGHRPHRPVPHEEPSPMDMSDSSV